MIIYSINDYLQSDSTLLSLSEKNEIIFNPLIGYEEDTAPIIIYTYTPDAYNYDLYYIHHDTVRYSVLDTDIDRGLSVRNRIMDLLNLGDNIQQSNIDDTYGRLLYINIMRSSEERPYEPDGYYTLSSYFDICWIPND